MLCDLFSIEGICLVDARCLLKPESFAGGGDGAPWYGDAALNKATQRTHRVLCPDPAMNAPSPLLSSSPPSLHPPCYPLHKSTILDSIYIILKRRQLLTFKVLTLFSFYSWHCVYSGDADATGCSVPKLFCCVLTTVSQVSECRDS